MSAAGEHLSDELLSTHLDGAVEAVDGATVPAHLAECAACARRLELMAATARAISGLPAESLPRALDLSFLPAPDRHPIVLADARRGWRPPPWAAPVLAAAAVLVVAVGVGPRLLAGVHPGGGTASSTTGIGQLASPSGTAADSSGRAVDGSILGPALPAPAGAPSQATNGGPAPGALARPALNAQQAYAADGVQLTLNSSAPAAAAGQPVTLTLDAAASRSVTVTSTRLVVQRAGAAETLASTSGTTLQAGQHASLSVTWSAGQVSGSPQPGDVTVTGHVALSDGRDLSVAITIHVT